MKLNWLLSSTTFEILFFKSASELFSRFHYCAITDNQWSPISHWTSVSTIPHPCSEAMSSSLTDQSHWALTRVTSTGEAYSTFSGPFLSHKLPCVCVCVWEALLKELRCVHRGRETRFVCASNITFIQIHNSSIFQLQFWGWNAVEKYAKWWRFVYFWGVVWVWKQGKG